MSLPRLSHGFCRQDERAPGLFVVRVLREDQPVMENGLLSGPDSSIELRHFHPKVAVRGTQPDRILVRRDCFPDEIISRIGARNVPVKTPVVQSQPQSGLVFAEGAGPVPALLEETRDLVTGPGIVRRLAENFPAERERPFRLAPAAEVGSQTGQVFAGLL